MTATKPRPTTSNFNVANVLTSLRIIAVPFFAWLVLASQATNHHLMWLSVAVFVALMITDKLDGDIARHYNLVTDFGKIADPIADKALMITALVSLNLVGRLWWIATVVIVIREIGITVWRMRLLRRGTVVPASSGGKIKTVLQSLAVLLFLVPIHGGWMIIPALVMAAAVAVTVWTGWQYVAGAARVASPPRVK